MKLFNLMIISIIIFLVGCTYLGKVEKPKSESISILNPPIIKFNKNFSQLLTDYLTLNFTDCGKVVFSHFRNNEGNSQNTSYCIREAFKSCKPAKAFYFADTEEKYRTASFLSVYPEVFGGCKMANHYISEDSKGYKGEFYMYCHKINIQLPDEYLCLDNGKDVQPVL